MLFDGQQFYSALLQYEQEVEVQLNVTGNTVRLVRDDRFDRRIAHFIVVKYLVQRRSVFGSAADGVIEPPVDDVSVLVRVFYYRVALDFRSVFVIVSLGGRADPDVSDRVFLVCLG